MLPNLKPSQRAAIVASIDPQSATTVKVSGWVSMKNWLTMQAVIKTGVITATGTVDAKLQQATDSSGTGAKDITGKAITQMVATTNNNQQAVINLRSEQMDVNNGFNYVQLSVTPATAAALISADLWGWDPVYGVASDNAATSVAQVV